MAKKQFYDYEGRLAVIRFEPKRCIHAEECVHGLPDVFERHRRPWIDPDKGSPQELADIVPRCPSGSLSIERLDGGPAEDPSGRNRARPVPDGPLYVEGDLDLELSDGSCHQQRRVALCRCGESENKPYCDNSHLTSEFADNGALGKVSTPPSEEDPEGSVRLRVVANGPISFQGPLEMMSSDGRNPEVRIKGSLCRCGASQNKPFCDGSHRAVGFEAE